MTKFSIIIATYNAEKYIERCLNSIIKQSLKDFELIIIDGQSKDNTVNIIKKHESHIKYWISEPDKGIYDAWNKGILQSKGKWIAFLGADDQYLPSALEYYNKYINIITNIDYISSRMQIIDENSKDIRIKGWPWKWPQYLKEMGVAHPGSFHSKHLFEKYGLFDTKYKSSGDFELLLRAKDKLKAHFMNEVTVLVQDGGISDSFLGIKEHCQIAINKGKMPRFDAYLNALGVYLKYLGKKSFRSIGLNVYIKK